MKHLLLQISCYALTCLMLPIIYEPPIITAEGDFLAVLMSTQDFLSRLDERARRSPLREGWTERLLIDEACACQLTEGDLVHPDELMLLDARALVGGASIPLASALHILHTWRRALMDEPADLLRAHHPGQADREWIGPPPSGIVAADAPEVIDIARRDAWRRVLRQTEAFTPLLAAAIVWDAWLMLKPEAAADWRAPLLASLVLKARGVTSQFLLPLDTGRRHAPYRRHAKQPIEARLTGFLEWAQKAAKRAGRKLDNLGNAEGVMRQKIATRRKHSRLPALIDLMLSRSAISVPMAAAHLGVSPQAVERMLPKLGAVPQEVTGRARFRLWSV